MAGLALPQGEVWAWSVLPTSTLCELAGLTVCAINILGTLILEPGRARKLSAIGETPLKSA